MGFDPAKVTVLLVEDAAVMRKIEIRTLGSLGFDQIVEAVDGAAAVRLLETGTVVDLIISDWNMPNMDGLELLKWVRARESTRTVPFLMATGQGEKKQEQRALEAGVSSFVAKPFNEQELRVKIDEAFGLKARQVAAAPLSSEERLTDDGKVRLRMAHIQITDHLILGVLKHLIARGDLKPSTFELETECMAGWNPVQSALETGAVDGACILAPIAMDLFGYGVPIRLVLLAHKNGSIFVRNRAGDYRPPYAEFFRGKSFYIPHKLSIHHMLAHLFFEQAGLRPGMAGEGKHDVIFEIVAPVKMQESMQSNPDVGGFMVAEPLGTRAIASAAAQLQFLSSELWENHPCCAVAMRQDFIDAYPNAVHELTEMLVEAGKFIDKKPEIAAEIGVPFLDPNRQLGLKATILKNVLKEAQGIKTGDLFPDVAALKQMHAYMHDRMGIGTPIVMEELVDLRFAERAYQKHNRSPLYSRLHDNGQTTAHILERSGSAATEDAKSKLNLEGKYLTLTLCGREYGIDILRIREIIGMQPTRQVPNMPPHIKGVINLRGKVIPVMDLKAKFGLGVLDENDRNCIVVLETTGAHGPRLTGLAVESVSEVTALKSSEIEPTPTFGAGIDTGHILAMAKTGPLGVKLLLNIDHLVSGMEPEAEAA
ncbi:MAG: chemotaxis protein CheW [Syntrophobacteraceae bacterium]|nr:chemotaxis protein CheW [Syntrophobacteraceae bacterium]